MAPPAPSPAAALPTATSLPAACTTGASRPGDFVAEVDTADGARSYRLHVPPGYRPDTPTPVVLNFHGYNRDAAQQETYSGLVPVSDTGGFLLITPEGGGSPRGWDIPGIYNENGIDDVAAVLDILAAVERDFCVDARRVYATGHSNGGEMAVYLACTHPELIAAAAPVSGMDYAVPCESGRPVPLVNFQGTDDRLVPYEATIVPMAAWAAMNGCDPVPEVTQTSAHVSRQVWQGCDAATEAYIIEGGGHTWPGAVTPGGDGAVTDELEASTVLWAFFAANPMP
ncbi:MAG: prolyl oligopeptidase family serine peptidase [Chloroflexi bacterium]|nr:prolyl oligopeptidase family serine peptidase [Chloroflexota bacterium]